MIIPTNIATALLIVVFVVPGFVFGSVRTALRAPRGRQDTEISSRLVFAVVTSVIFDAVYLLAVGVILPSTSLPTTATSASRYLASEPVFLGSIVLALGVGLPAAVALAMYYRIRWETREDSAGVRGRFPRPVRRGGWRQFPTAWGRAVPGLGGTYVRVRLESGRWIGGYFSSDSFVGTYPHTRDIYIQRQFAMKRNGSFGDPVPSSSGVWLAIGDNDVVEWLTPEEVRR